MKVKRLKNAIAAGGIAVMFSILPLPALAEEGVSGAITGRIFDRDDRTPLANVLVRAHTLSSNRDLADVRSDRQGNFFIPDAPAGVYTFTLGLGDKVYRVAQRLDARAAMTFVLDTCFSIDSREQRASVLGADCSSQLVEQARVVTIGPHRFLRPAAENGTEAVVGEGSSAPAAGSPASKEGSVGPFIEHSELECLTRDEFPVVDSIIRPGERIEVSRVYFRSDKYPDFYYIDMRRRTGDAASPVSDDPESFLGILPKPTPETERIIYYVEAVDNQYNNAQTREHDPEITDEEGCKRRPGAFVTDDPAIVVGATVAGVPAVPPGFQALGITGFISAAGVSTAVTAAAAGGAAAAGAGVSSGLILVVTGAAVAGGGAIVGGTTGGGEGSPP